MFIVEKVSIFRTEDVLYGILDSPRKCLALNHLIILGKYFLYINTGLKNKVQFNEYISLVRDKLALEKHIAIKSGKYDNYNTHRSYWF